MKFKCNNIVKNIRLNILNLTFKAKSSHIGSRFSIVEILAALYYGVLKKSDRFTLIKDKINEIYVISSGNKLKQLAN